MHVYVNALNEWTLILMTAGVYDPKSLARQLRSKRHHRASVTIALLDKFHLQSSKWLPPCICTIDIVPSHSSHPELGWFLHLLNLDCPWDLLWATEWGGSDGVAIPSTDLKSLCMLSLFLLDLGFCHVMSLESPTYKRMRSPVKQSEAILTEVFLDCKALSHPTLRIQTHTHAQLSSARLDPDQWSHPEKWWMAAFLCHWILKGLLHSNS